MRTCSKCALSKPEEDFYSYRKSGKLLSSCKVCCKAQSKSWANANKDKKTASAKRCYDSNPEKNTRKLKGWREANPDKVRAYHVMRKYGLTTEQYSALLRSQNDSCAVCDTPRSEMEREICVDHNKMTNVVRGLLCHGCNTAFGLLKEDERTIMRLLEYVRKHQ